MLPVVKIFILAHPGSHWLRNRRLVNALLPFTLNALKAEDKLNDESDRAFRTYQYLGNISIDILMLFTFGICCPFLIFLIVFSIMANELVNHLQIGSYFHDAKLLSESRRSTSKGNGTKNEKSILENSDELGEPTLDSEDPPEIIDEASKALFLESRIYFGKTRALYKAKWKHLLLSTLIFMTLILFDMVSDVYSIVPGFIATVCFWLMMLLCFYSKERVDLLMNLKYSFNFNCIYNSSKTANVVVDNNGDDGGVVNRITNNSTRKSVVELSNSFHRKSRKSTAQNPMMQSGKYSIGERDVDADADDYRNS